MRPPSAAPRPRSIDGFFATEFRAAGVSFACALVAFAVYAATASPWVASHDAAEFQTMARTGGIAHAGYPTVTLLLRAFGALPFGSLPYRANLLSCVSGAIACGCVAWLTARLTRRSLAGVAAAAALALSLTMWSESTQAGVHAFTLALDAVLLVATLRYVARPSARGALAIGLLFGIGLTSHLTVLATSFMLLAALVHLARSRSPRLAHLAVAAGGLALGLLPFLYLFAADRASQPMNYIADTLEPALQSFAVDAPNTRQRLERFAWLMSARQYLADPAFYALGTLVRRYRQLAVDLDFNEFVGATGLLAVAGLAALARRGGIVAGLLLALLAGALVCVGAGATPGMERIFFMPGLFVLAIGLGAAVAVLARTHAALAWLALAVVVGAPFLRLSARELPPMLPRSQLLSSVWEVWPERWNPLERDRGWDRFGRGVFAAVEPRAVLLTCWEEATTLRYFEHAEPLRAGVEVLYACGYPPRVQRLWRRAEAEGRPVYTTYEPTAEQLGDGTAELAWRDARGGLWRLRGPAGR